MASFVSVGETALLYLALWSFLLFGFTPLHLQSLAMGTFVTDPAISLGMLSLKLFVSWVLLRMDRKQKKKIKIAQIHLQDAVEDAEDTGDVTSLEAALKVAENAGVDQMALTKASDAAERVRNGQRPKRRGLAKSRTRRRRGKTGIDDLPHADRWAYVDVARCVKLLANSQMVSTDSLATDGANE